MAPIPAAGLPAEQVDAGVLGLEQRQPVNGRRGLVRQHRGSAATGGGEGDAAQAVDGVLALRAVGQATGRGVGAVAEVDQVPGPGPGFEQIIGVAVAQHRGAPHDTEAVDGKVHGT